MRYWFFDGKSPTGPYEEEELKKLPGFNSKSLICPESAQSSNQWKAAQYYLIKPPSQKPPESSVKLQEKTRMGRLAEIEEVEKKDRESQDAQKTQEVSVLPRSSRKKFWRALIFLCTLAAIVVYFFPKLRSLVLKPQVVHPNTANSQDENTDFEKQAIDFVQGFPVKARNEKYPNAISDVLSRGRWKSPKTIGDLLTMRSLQWLSFQTANFLRMGRIDRRSEENLIVKKSRSWNEWAQDFLKKTSEFQWTVSALSGSHYKVTAVSPLSWSLAGQRDIFDADIKAQTIKPLNFNAWYDLDPVALSHWASGNVQLGADIDNSALAQAAPTYSLSDFKKKDLPHHKSLRPILKTPVTRSLSRNKNINPPPVEVAPSIPLTSPAPQTAPSSTHKSATEMSVDELNKYLKRGQNPSPNNPNP